MRDINKNEYFVISFIMKNIVIFFLVSIALPCFFDIYMYKNNFFLKKKHKSIIIVNKKTILIFNCIIIFSYIERI